MFVACSESDVLPEVESPVQEQNNVIELSALRSLDEAYEIATKSTYWIDEQESRSSVRLLESKESVKVILGKSSRSSNPDTLMYVVNFLDNEGFAIIPANREFPELLAVTENGSYDPSVGSEVEPFNAYMNNATKILSTARVSLPIDTLRVPFRETWTVDTTYYTNVIAPKAPYRWTQSGIEGKYCPNGTCGCANLAAALCFAYYGYPTTVTYTTSEFPGMTETLNWNQIRPHDGSIFCTGYGASRICFEDVDTLYQNQLGRICRELGNRANSEYHPASPPDIFGVTSTYASGEISAVRSFGFNVSSANYAPSYIYQAVSAGIVMVVGSSAPISGENDAHHMWVIDGYRTKNYDTYTYEREAPIPGVTFMDPYFGWELVKETHSSTNYEHHNWGWGGQCNGYFLAGNWKPIHAEVYDDLYNGVLDYDFSSNRYYITVTR